MYRNRTQPPTDEQETWLAVDDAAQVLGVSTGVLIEAMSSEGDEQ